MAEISAALVKELRERTGAGMMECKKALVESGGDIEAAIEHLRKSGAAKAVKRAGKVAAEGRIAIALTDDQRRGVMLEVNCETDFVGRGDELKDFAQKVAELILAKPEIASVEAAGEEPFNEAGDSVETVRAAMVARIGENIQLRRFVRVQADGVVGAYIHGDRMGVVVSMNGGDAAAAKDVAMHVAASNPLCVDEHGVDPEILAKEREIYRAQAAESGKPADIVEKMVDGRIKKFLKENALLEQPFVKNPDITVAQRAKEAGGVVLGFTRYLVGEGIEKEAVDFAAEVAAQMRA